ncbi:adhesion G-protein coupled receptor G2-like [Lingula anatina]|uniref:Adhesion G-protein coupled receptor G2-like n=1 Tax=Lingula anatina TaxID=7574 RepID=A0A1S3HJ35_LINAN|nr:adhesion G-protein coupled receptor G2-like [Lingula anatina]|eukprot:XP_013385471.1 adhesion G-protein coupled receptor G2-like [Lingula anatina]
MITLSVNGLKLNQSDFIKDGEGVLICVDDYLGDKGNRTPESSYDLVQVIVSYSLLSISVLCLVFTIITYLLFTDLRKGLPGKNLFNLCVTLMLAQLLFLFNYVPSQNNAVCKAFAVVMHYWWLCSFAWMTACAFHMCWTFTYPFSIAQLDSSDIRKWHIIYCLISYCSPLVIVIPCVVLDFCECTSVSIGYGTGGSSCWIGNTMALAYSFALPVGVTILLQLGFFIKTAIALRPVPSVERCGSDYNQFLVYCKLSTLMGFGWIFAFFAAFTSLSFMWYLFYVFSCLQGAFIFFSYIMKKSTLHQYRNYFRKKSPGHISSTFMNMNTLTSAKNARSATYVAVPVVTVSNSLL